MQTYLNLVDTSKYVLSDKASMMNFMSAVFQILPDLD